MRVPARGFLRRRAQISTPQMATAEKLARGTASDSAALRGRLRRVGFPWSLRHLRPSAQPQPEAGLAQRVLFEWAMAEGAAHEAGRRSGVRAMPAPHAADRGDRGAPPESRVDATD